MPCNYCGEFGAFTPCPLCGEFMDEKGRWRRADPGPVPGVPTEPVSDTLLGRLTAAPSWTTAFMRQPGPAEAPESLSEPTAVVGEADPVPAPAVPECQVEVFPPGVSENRPGGRPMRVTIEITEAELTVRQYDGDQLLKEQRYGPRFNDTGSFSWVAPFQSPKAPGGRFSCMVFFLADGGEKGENLADDAAAGPEPDMVCGPADPTAPTMPQQRRVRPGVAEASLPIPGRMSGAGHLPPPGPGAMVAAPGKRPG